jgi:hypothetical protein
MGSLITRSVITIYFFAHFINSIKLNQNDAKSLLSRISGSSAGVTNVKLKSGEATAIEENNSDSSLKNGKISALLAKKNQSGLLLRGSASGKTATTSDHEAEVDGSKAKTKSSNSAATILESLGGKGAATSLTTGGTNLQSDDSEATEKRETATISELEGLGTASTGGDTKGVLLESPLGTSGLQSGNNESKMNVEEGAGNTETANENQMKLNTLAAKASTLSSSSSSVGILGNGNADTMSAHTNSIDLAK